MVALVDKYRRLCRRGFNYLVANGFRATLRRLAQYFGISLGTDALFGYELWCRLYGLSEQDRTAIRTRIDAMADKPLISVLLPETDLSAFFLTRSIESVQAQLYPCWELLLPAESAEPDLLAGYVAGDERIKVASPGDAQGRFLVPLAAGDRLAETALFLLASEIGHHPDAAVIYGDCDRIDAGDRRSAPFFKPDWDIDLFYGVNLLSPFLAVRRDLAPDADFAPDRMLDVVAALPAAVIRHLPAVLYHRHRQDGEDEPGFPAGPSFKALARHFHGRPVTLEAPGPGRRPRIRHHLPDPAPLVSVVIPTRDGLDLLRQCIDGLLNGTDYPAIEVIVVDNGSRDPATLAYFEEMGGKAITVLRYDQPFNFSAINNLAVARAGGSVVALLNNDIKIIHPDWLTEMVAQALRPDVGAVGAKLLYADGSLQHAGVVTGMGGVAGHIYRTFQANHPGSHGELHHVHELSCVTAACMVLRKEVYEAVGGFEESLLPVAFNDVDLCLRIRAKGYRILWTPYAELYHLESATRGPDDAPERLKRFAREIKAMEERWSRDFLIHDPFYNPNLALDCGQGNLAFPPRLDRFW